jgi:hypothetical protein
MQVKVNESESKISIKVFLPLRNSRAYVAICNVLEAFETIEILIYV